MEWCCEECDISKGLMSSLGEQENEHSEGSKIHAAAKICQCTGGHSKFPGGHCNHWEKAAKTGKTRYLPVKEALGLLSGMEKYGSPLITVSSRLMSTKSVSIVQRSFGSAGYAKPQNLQNAKISEQSQKTVQLSKGGSIILEHRIPDAVNESRMINSSTTHPCDPALVPSWKGSFDILGYQKLAPGIFNNYVQAHPPSRVRREVYEFSGLLPDTLQLELVPRWDIWASLFNNHCPDKDDIGLYFFSSERKRSDKPIYIDLVEYMRMKDLVMRTIINDVELVILASTALCSDSQRLNNEHFLWGLFYRMGQDTDGCAEGGSNKVIDMEIDMIAGENVGTLDIVVSTTTRNGFDTSLKETVTASTCNGSESVTPLVS
ncbi:uncharacterized protein LOC129900683 [Solanum dulcamara]|uniref:uncharacterized protein LOC129900683 n=1 Tax=Solanum dulcamara TaxID=45834 RepID=UPI00248671A7|nr:uncharacterized protein LOC129900683 [Solanum dulcamara]